jgi:predicted ATPase/class 3 adenylate cyclase
MNALSIKQAITALEQHRSQLGQDVTDVSLAALKSQLSQVDANHISAPNLRGERKQVTVMFADISGFTAMSEKLDPEEVRNLINGCFEQLGGVIERYEGHFDKFIGDEIMALFGAPVTHENDPERALRAALEMMDALSEFNHANATLLPKPLALHFGINTGLVIAGGIGTSQRQDYSVMGDTVNLAARLEDLSEAGEILVGENTFRFTAPLFNFTPLEPINVKGKSQPIQLYRLLAAKPIAGGQIRGIDGLQSTLVGRDAELAQLETAVQKLRDGQGMVVSVVGDAGLGKSRLVAELESTCVRGEVDMLWARGRALSYADTASYLIARDTLRSLLNISPTAEPVSAVAKLQARIEKIFPGQMAEIFPYLGTLLDVPLNQQAEERIKYLDGRVLHERVLQTAQDFILGVAGQTPIVLVWEDLHWADPSSLELLNALLPHTQNHRLLLLLVYRRPVSGSKIWRFRQDLSQALPRDCHVLIELPPLTPEDSHNLLTNLLGDGALPAHIHNMIVSKAEGNPLYLEEVIRSLIDRRALTKTAEGWRLSNTVDQISLPDTLQGIIMARIDQLDRQAKRVLQVASVMGRNFRASVLAKVFNGYFPNGNEQSPVQPDQLPEILARLANIDLVSLSQDQPESIYTFWHVFTQESVYGSLLRSDRRQLHLQVGVTLEQEFLLSDANQNSVATLALAHHFEEAQDTARAIQYLELAADKVSASYANREARILYQRTLALLPTTNHAERWDTLARLEKVLDRLGERNAQAEVLTQMQTASLLLQDNKRQTITHIRRSKYFDRISEYQAAAEAANTGLRTARISADEQLQAQSLNLLALAAWRRFDYREVQRWAEEALEAIRIIGEPETHIASLFHLGKSSYRLGQYDLALRYIRAAQELSHNFDNRDGEATSHMILGWIYQRLAYYDQAEDHFETMGQIRSQIGDRYGQATALSHLGWLAFDQKNPTRGLEYCQQALQTSEAVGDRENKAYALGGLALNYEQLNRLDEAAKCYQAALDIHQGIGTTPLATFDQAGLARVALAKNDHNTARTYIAPVVTWVQAGNAQKFWDPWIIYLTSYHVLIALGDTDLAISILTEAHTLLHQRADEISDQELRDCFLERAETNRILQNTWNSLQVGASQ